MSARSSLHEATRTELHRLLINKLITKYGQEESEMRMRDEPVNRLIKAEVDLFMHNHKKVQSGDLVELEKKVRHAARAKRGSQCFSPRSIVSSENNTRPGSLTHRSATSESRKSASCGAAQLSQRGSPHNPRAAPVDKRADNLSIRKQRPSTAGSATSCSRQQYQKKNWRELSSAEGTSARCCDDNFVPPNIKNEWLILETYQQMKTDEVHAEKERRAKEAVQRCKKDLDEQVKQKLARAEQEKRESEAQIDDLRRQTMEHETHQAKLREATRKMLLEEKCARALQILDNKRRRDRERLQKQKEENRTLAESKSKLREEKEAQLKKRKQNAESLQAMQRENVAKIIVQEKRKILEAEEDKRLMREYQERLDREHAERAAAHLARMQRYEEIGTHWAETGAGKKQHEIEIAEERRILSEATIKEKADEDREKRDKDKLRLDRLRCIEDNRRLIAEKIARKEAEDAEETRFAQNFRLDGEMYAAKDAEDRRREVLREQKAYARGLKDQMKATKATRAAVQMTVREREMNGRVLRLLQSDRKLQQKVSERLLRKGPGAKS